MIRPAALTLIAAIAFAMPTAGAFAQPAPATPQTGTGPITARPDRTTADRQTREQMAQRRAALKQKRAGCAKQASAQGLHLLKRSRFIKQCMAE